MATEYKHEKDGDDFKIFRNDEHVATFDPVTEEVTYTHGNDKYAGPVAKEVNNIKNASPAEGLTADKIERAREVFQANEGQAPDAPTGEGVSLAEDAPIEADVDGLKAEIFRLESELADARKVNDLLSKENADLRGNRQAEQSGANRVPERYADKVDDSKAPAQDPALGDLTPAYIEWAREGGMKPEVFLRRYKGRIKDLSTPTAEPSE